MVLYQKSPCPGLLGGVALAVDRVPPPQILPVAVMLPVTFAPSDVNNAMLDVPPMPIATLPPELTTTTLDVPLLILLVLKVCLV